MKTFIIIGKQNSGKTQLVKEITNGKKTVWLSESDLNSAFAFRSVDNETEYIVIDGLSKLDAAKLILNTNNFIRHKPMHPAEIIKTPKIIITSNTIIYDEVSSNDIQIIECKKNN